MATATINLLSFAFHVIFSRSLGPADYSALGALLAVIVVVSVPLGAVQLAAAKAAATSDPAAGASSLIRRWTLYAGLIFVVFVAASPAIKFFLRLNSVVPCIFLAGWLASAASSAAAQGVLVGRQRYFPVATSLLLGSGGLRLATGLVLSQERFGVSGAMAATMVGQIGTNLLLLHALRFSFKNKDHQLKLDVGDGVVSAVALSGFALFGSVDDILARHLFVGQSPGFYVAAATLGRVALFLPGSIALIVFPVFTRQGTQTDERRAFFRSFGAVFGLGALVALFTIAFPNLVVRIFFGSDYLQAVPLLRYLAIAGAILGCLNLTMYFHIAHRSRNAYVSWLGSLLVIVLAYALDVDRRALAIIALVAASAACIWSLATTRSYYTEG